MEGKRLLVMCHISDLLELHQKRTKKLKLTQQAQTKVTLGQLVLLLSQSDLVDLMAVPSFEVRMLEPGNVYVIPPCMVMQEYSIGHSAMLMFAGWLRSTSMTSALSA